MADQLRVTWMLRLLVTCVLATVGLAAWPSVGAVDPSDNRRAGASIGNQCRGLPDGTVVQIVVTG